MKGKKYVSVVLSAVFCLVLINGVYALGVSSPYWDSSPYQDSNPLELKAGEVRDVSFTLINKVEDEETDVLVSLVEGEEIAEITTGESYVLPQGPSEVKVNLRISVSENAVEGEIYNVRFNVNPAGEEGSGTVQLGVGYSVNFPVIVVGGDGSPSAYEDSGSGGGGKVLFIGLFVVLALAAGVAVFLVFKNKAK